MKNNDELTETENMSDDESSELLPACLDIGDDKSDTCSMTDDLSPFTSRYPRNSMSMQSASAGKWLSSNRQTKPGDGRRRPSIRTHQDSKTGHLKYLVPKKQRNNKKNGMMNAEDEEAKDESQENQDIYAVASKAVNSLCSRLKHGHGGDAQAPKLNAVPKPEDPTSSKPSKKRRKSFRTKVGKSRFMYVRPTISKKNPWAAFWPHESKTTYMGSFKTEEGAARAINQRCDDLGIKHKAIVRLSRSSRSKKR